MIADRLDERDRAVVADLQRVRILTGRQLERLHHGAGDAAKQRRVRQLARLTRWRVITPLARRVGGVEGGSASAVYALDVGGQHFAASDGRRRPPWTPSTPFLNHTIAVSELYVRLREAERTGTLEVLDFETEPDCWRHYPGRGGEPVVLKPDAAVVVADVEFEQHVFVELDMGTTSVPRLRRKAALYTDYRRTGLEQERGGVFPLVVWTTPEPSQLDRLTDAVCPTDPEICRATTVEDFVALLLRELRP